MAGADTTLATIKERRVPPAHQQKMDIHEFGDALIRTRDLDPVYCGLYEAALPRDQLCRLLLSYWCFYHLGAAAWMSEHYGADFWHAMDVAARNEDASPLGGRWPRAAERRHFRGQKCVEAVRWFSQQEPEIWVEQMVFDLYGAGLTDRIIMDRVQCWPMFGPWIAFKCADMAERCLGVPVQFDPDLGLMYAEPRKALDILAEEQGGPDCVSVGPEGWYSHLLEYFGRHRAPPAMDRACGPQEAETVLCKWKSHMNGYYPVGKDIHEQRVALAGWGKTADRLLAVYPGEVAA